MELLSFDFFDFSLFFPFNILHKKIIIKKEDFLNKNIKYKLIFGFYNFSPTSNSCIK